MDLIAIGVIAAAFAILLSLPRRERQDREERRRENWSWPPR